MFAQTPRRREASPEGPARALKNPLTGHVSGPPVGTMKGVEIALDSKSSVVGPFHVHIQTIGAALHRSWALPESPWQRSGSATFDRNRMSRSRLGGCFSTGSLQPLLAPDSSIKSQL